MKMLGRWAGVCVCTAVMVAHAPLVRAAQAGAAADAAVTEKGPAFARVVDGADGGTVALEIAVRRMKPPEGAAAPELVLVGAVHIGDKSYYEACQAILDAQEVVLFEAVKPPGMGAGGETDEERAASTERRIRLAGMMVESYRGQKKALPGSMDELAAGLSGRLARVARGGMTDAWGRTLVIERVEAEDGTAKYDVVSLGADGAAGGEGAAKDLRLSAQKPLSRAERGGGGAVGIQEQMARALGLTYQMQGINYERANWRNSDLSVDEVQARIEAAGGGDDAEALFRLLDGSSMTGRMASMVLRFVGASEQLSMMSKVMMIEMLGRADALMGSGGMGGGMGGGMMRVIIDDRNQVVVDDLKRLISEEPGVRSVGVFYGAGHLPDLEQRLEKQLGYTIVETTWLAAITADLNAAGMTPEQAKAMRRTVQRTIEQQLQRSVAPRGRGAGDR